MSKKSEISHPLFRGTRLLLLSPDTPQAAGAAGSDKSDLLTSRSEAVRRGRVPDVLVVTTTEGVLHRVHCHTTHMRPLVALDAEPYYLQTREKTCVGKETM